MLGDDSGDDNCEAGWHGERCDKSGDFQNCQNGTQNASTGACDCTAGWQGDLCQYPSDWCTKVDAGATYDDAAKKCTCSTDASTGKAKYSGPRCTQAAAGFVLGSDGKVQKWQDGWSKVSSTATVTFQGGKMSISGCTNCNDAGANGSECSTEVDVCKLLTQNASTSTPGCSSLENVCDTGIVPSVTHGGGSTCMLMQSCGGTGYNNNAWFEKMTVPDGVEVDMKTKTKFDSSAPLTCGAGSTPTDGVSTVTSSAPWQPAGWHQDVTMTFKPSPGHMVTCPTTGGGTQTFLGAETATAKYSTESGTTTATSSVVQLG
jgi:hypothetical protein